MRVIKRGDIVHWVDQFGMPIVRAGASLLVVTSTRGRRVWVRPVSDPFARVEECQLELAVVEDDDLDRCRAEARAVVDTITRELKRRQQ